MEDDYFRHHAKISSPLSDLRVLTKFSKTGSNFSTIHIRYIATNINRRLTGVGGGGGGVMELSRNYFLSILLFDPKVDFFILPNISGILTI